MPKSQLIPLISPAGVKNYRLLMASLRRSSRPPVEKRLYECDGKNESFTFSRKTKAQKPAPSCTSSSPPCSTAAGAAAGLQTDLRQQTATMRQTSRSTGGLDEEKENKRQEQEAAAQQRDLLVQEREMQKERKAQEKEKKKKRKEQDKGEKARKKASDKLDKALRVQHKRDLQRQRANAAREEAELRRTAPSSREGLTATAAQFEFILQQVALGLVNKSLDRLVGDFTPWVGHWLPRPTTTLPLSLAGPKSAADRDTDALRSACCQAWCDAFNEAYYAAAATSLPAQLNRTYRQHLSSEILREIGMLDRKLLEQPEFKAAKTQQEIHLRAVAWRRLCAKTLDMLVKLNKPSPQEQPVTSLVAPVDSINAHDRGLVLHRAGWLWHVQYRCFVRGRNKNNAMQRLVLRSMRSSAKQLPRRWSGQELDFVDSREIHGKLTIVTGEFADFIMCIDKKMRTLLSLEMLVKHGHELFNVVWTSLETDFHISKQWMLLVEATLNRLHLSPLVKPHLHVESGCADGVVKVRLQFNIEAVADINAPAVREFCSTLRVNLIRTVAIFTRAPRASEMQ